ncbi:MAG: hypothetical protein RML35_15880 [Chloroherpetonaceae bacterium]|nr:hypothetical protein [Chloroherpetonaceae bacterium]
MPTAAALHKFSLPFAEDDEARLLELARGSKLILGALKTLLLTNSCSEVELSAECQSISDTGTLSQRLLEQALAALTKEEFTPLYALCVVLSQATEPLSEKELETVWRQLAFPASFPSAEELLYMLLPLHFIEVDTHHRAPKFRLNAAVRAEVLKRLSEEDRINANTAFAIFYSNLQNPTDSQLLKHQHHLIAAKLHKEAVQLAAAYSPALMKADKTETALQLLQAAIPLAESLSEEVALFLRHQLATGSAKLAQYEVAIEQLTVIATRLQKAGNTAAEYAARYQLNSALAAKGDYAAALTGFQELMQKQAEHKNMSGVAAAAAQVGLAALALHDAERAVEHFYIAKRLSEKLSDMEQKISEQNWSFLREELGSSTLNKHLAAVQARAEAFCRALQAA